MALIVGLDLGSYSVKALWVEAAFRNTAVKRWAEVKLGAGERPAALAAALAELARDRGLVVDQVAVALPGLGVASQAISLPFKTDKQIEAALPGEVAEKMGFEEDEIVFDKVPISESDAGVELLVGTARRDAVRPLLEQLKAAAVEPRLVTLPALALAPLLAEVAPLPSGPIEPAKPGDHAPDPSVVAVVDIGHERVSMVIGTANQLSAARTFSGGGANLTRILAQDFKVSPEEANTWKEKNADLTEKSRDANEEAAYGALRRGLSPVVRELRQTLRSFQAQTHRAASKLYLAGGTARIRGLTQHLERELGIPCALLKLDEALTGATGLQSGDGALAAQALGLARSAQGVGKAARFNLRRGEFAFKSDFEYLKGKLGRLGAYAGVLVLLYGVLSYAELSSLMAREKTLDAKLGEQTQKVLGKPELDFTRALSMLREHNAPGAALPQNSAVEVLAEMTSRVPRDVAAKLTDIEMTTGRMRVRGTVDSFDSVDKLTNALKTYRCFTTVNKGKVDRDNKSQNRVAFSLDIEVNCAPPPQG